MHATIRFLSAVILAAAMTAGAQEPAAGTFSLKERDLIRELAGEKIDPGAWKGTAYHTNRQNYKDRIVSLSEEIASELETMMADMKLIRRRGRYLEIHVGEVLSGG